MTAFSPTGTLDPVQAYDLLATFAQRYGRLPLRLAMHAAVPQGFRLDLLHLLKLNFVPEAANDTTVEADMILAGICRDLGDGYFEFDPEVRRLLLDSLVDTYSGESPPRVRRVANFLLSYIEQLTLNPYDHKKRLRRDYLEIQRWVALGFLNPEQAAYQLAAALDQAEAAEEVTVRVRLGGLASVLSTPLVQHDRLLTYAVGLQALETGHYEQAQALLAGLGKQEIRIGDIRLRSPATILQEWQGQREPAPLQVEVSDAVTVEGQADVQLADTALDASGTIEDEPVDLDVLIPFIKRLNVNLQILRERAAKQEVQGIAASLDVQIRDYERALQLVNPGRTERSSARTLQAQLEEFDLGIEFDLTKKYYDNLFADYNAVDEILKVLDLNLERLKARESQYNPLEVPLELLNRIYDYERAIKRVRQYRSRGRSLEEIKTGLSLRNYDINSFVGDTGPLDKLYLEGMRAMETENWRAAITFFQSILAVSDFKDTPQLLERVRQKVRLETLYDEGKHYYETNNWAAAIKIFENVIQGDLNFKDTEQLLVSARWEDRLQKLYSEAITAIGEKRWKDAIPLLIELVDYDPDFRDVGELLDGVQRQLNREKEVQDFGSVSYYSCFISYSQQDEAFAKQLYDDLHTNGVRCWFAPEDLRVGQQIRPAIDQALRTHDKLLLIISEHSIQSDWVKAEVETALKKEREQNELVLFPIRIDDAVLERVPDWATEIRRTRNIGDFTYWKEENAYQQAFQRLLNDLKIDRKSQIENLQSLLAQYRYTLSRLREQEARFGTGMTPLYLLGQIVEVENNIAELKVSLKELIGDES